MIHQGKFYIKASSKRRKQKYNPYTIENSYKNNIYIEVFLKKKKGG